MTTKFYIDDEGNYLGGFDGYQPDDIIAIVLDDDGNEIETIITPDYVMPALPIGAIEVPNPPPHGDNKYVNGAWVESPEQRRTRIKLELDVLERDALMPRGARETFIALCEQQGQLANLTKAELYAVNPFYKGLIDRDNEAKALRAQL